MATGSDQSDVRTFLERSLRDDSDVTFAAVFGSRADGAARSTSDLDVAVKFDDGLTREERFRKRVRLSGRLQREGAPFVDVADVEALPIEVAAAAVDGDLLCGDEGAFRDYADRIEAAFEERREEIERRDRETISRIAAGGLRG